MTAQIYRLHNILITNSHIHITLLPTIVIVTHDIWHMEHTLILKGTIKYKLMKVINMSIRTGAHI